MHEGRYVKRQGRRRITPWQIDGEKDVMGLRKQQQDAQQQLLLRLFQSQGQQQQQQQIQAGQNAPQPNTPFVATTPQTVQNTEQQPSARGGFFGLSSGRRGTFLS
jgi:hypothetical protein